VLKEQQVIVALGSNLGDRESNLRFGMSALADISRVPLLMSSFWETPAVGAGDASPDYLNAVVCLATDLSPQHLLGELETLEKARGDRIKGDNSPRYLDLDIILYGNLVIESANLTVPHPRFRERLFVLMPLQEIYPDLVIDGISINNLIEASPMLEIRKI